MRFVKSKKEKQRPQASISYLHSEGDIGIVKNRSSEKSHQRFALEALEVPLEVSMQFSNSKVGSNGR